MELLVYARNYPSDGPNAPERCERGAMAGDGGPSPRSGDRPCSFVEVCLPLSVHDPWTEIELLVVKAFAAWGHPGRGRVLRFGTSRGSVAMLLEPGFQRARDLCRALRPVLPQARALLEGSTNRPPPRRQGAPMEVVSPEDERVVPLRLLQLPLPPQLAFPPARG